MSDERERAADDVVLPRERQRSDPPGHAMRDLGAEQPERPEARGDEKDGLDQPEDGDGDEVAVALARHGRDRLKPVPTADRLQPVLLRSRHA